MAAHVAGATWLAAMMAAVTATGWAAIEVPLTVTERAGVPRTNELAAGGVPMPKGAAKDATGFGVVGPDGHAVPAQFTVLNRWPDDGSVRWMLVEFPVSCAAGETKTFTLKQGAENPPPPHPLTVRETPNDVVILQDADDRMNVRKRGFSLTGDDQGFVIMTTAGEMYTTAADTEARVTTEDAGPLRATVRIDGHHRSAKGEALFAYRVRLHVRAVDQAVGVQYTFTSDSGPYSNTPVDLKEVSLTIPAPGRGPYAASFGGAGKMHEAILKAGESVRLAVPASDEYVLTGALQATGPAKASKDLNLGWCSMSGDRESGTMAVRWFWQLYPKAFTLSGDGKIKIELVSPDGTEPVHIYRGMAKTHDLLLAPGEKGRPARDAAVGFQQPLFVKCSPSWYSQDTLGFGRLVSSDYTGLKPEAARFVKLVDDGFTTQVDVIRKARDEVVDEKLKQDSYGLVHFGDGFHHRASSSHRGIQWDNCYYSYTHMLAMQYARTGSDLIFDTLREAATFEGDSAIAWEADGTAAPRVNPGAYHVGGFGSFDNGPSGSWNFYKPIGMMELYYLTGDRRHLDAGRANFNWMLRHDGYDIYHNPRSVGAGLRAAVHGYLATGNRDFLIIARDVARKAVRFYQAHGHFAPVPNSVFMCPNALEGLCTYHELTGDEELGKVLPALVAAHRTNFARNPANLEYAYANLYTARLAGDETLRQDVEKALCENARFGIVRGAHAVKDFAAGKRGVPLIFWYLSDRASTPPTPWGKVDLGPERPDRLEIAGPSAEGKGTPLDLVSCPNVAKAPAAATRLSLRSDEKNLYLSVQAAEPRLDLLKVDVQRDGGPTYNDDCVEIYAGPASRRFAVKLMVNAAGVRAASVRGHYPKEAPAVAPADFPVTAARDKDTWRLDVTIPFAKIGLTDVKPGTELAFNVIRYRVGRGREKPGETSTWQGSSNQIESSGTIVLGN